jgi:hypothetical protein
MVGGVRHLSFFNELSTAPRTSGTVHFAQVILLLLRELDEIYLHAEPVSREHTARLASLVGRLNESTAVRQPLRRILDELALAQDASATTILSELSSLGAALRRSRSIALAEDVLASVRDYSRIQKLRESYGQRRFSRSGSRASS